jgi:hypothetical protein
MTPSARAPGTLSTSDDAWEAWWRERVAKDLERLDNNDQAIRKELNDACTAIRKELGLVDKTASVDIRDLQVRAAIGGFLGGTVATIIVGVVLFLIEQKLGMG